MEGERVVKGKAKGNLINAREGKENEGLGFGGGSTVESRKQIGGEKKKGGISYTTCR